MKRHDPLVSAYLKRIEQEARQRHKRFPGHLDTIYFGGGTPSHLSDKELAFLVSVLADTWGFPAAQETTLEADPLTFDAARLKFFRSLGFNRLSIGVQSTQDEVLKFLGRQHSGEEGLAAVRMALEAGFEVSADVITAVAGQDTARDLHALAQTGVTHLSAYNLTIEPFTPFARRGVQVDEDKEARDYALTNDILSSYGLMRYEVSSHAKPGHESKHNQVYWHGNYFLALGPSAAGFEPAPARYKKTIGIRRTNLPIKAWLTQTPPETQRVNQEDYVLDVLMTGLRTTQGVNLTQLSTRSNINVATRYDDLINDMTQKHLLELSCGQLRATPEGLLQLNRVLLAFFSH